MGVAVAGTRVKDGHEQVCDCVVSEFAQRAVAWIDKDEFEDETSRQVFFETIGRIVSRGLKDDREAFSFNVGAALSRAADRGILSIEDLSFDEEKSVATQVELLEASKSRRAQSCGRRASNDRAGRASSARAGSCACGGGER